MTQRAEGGGQRAERVSGYQAIRRQEIRISGYQESGISGYQGIRRAGD